MSVYEDDAIAAVVSKICGAIQSARICLSNEKATQEAIGAVLIGAGLNVEREVHLNKGKDIPDFIVNAKGKLIAVEVKIKGARKIDVYKQLKRYAQHNTISALVLVTSLSMGLPPVIEGKPAYYASLGRAWL